MLRKHYLDNCSVLVHYDTDVEGDYLPRQTLSQYGKNYLTHEFDKVFYSTIRV